jgi:hypothetical protein
MCQLWSPAEHPWTLSSTVYVCTEKVTVLGCHVPPTMSQRTLPNLKNLSAPCRQELCCPHQTGLYNLPSLRSLPPHSQSIPGQECQIKHRTTPSSI